MAEDLRLYLRAVEAIDWTKVQTQHEEEHYADWFLVDHKVLMYAGEPEDQVIEFMRRAPAAIRQLIADVELWRERAETAEREVAHLRALFLQRCGAIERVRHVCHKAKTKKDAPGMWLVADQVLAALPEETTDDSQSPALEPETSALRQEEKP